MDKTITTADLAAAWDEGHRAPESQPSNIVRNPYLSDEENDARQAAAIAAAERRGELGSARRAAEGEGQVRDYRDRYAPGVMRPEYDDRG